MEEHFAGRPRKWCLLTEKGSIWAGILAEVLQQHSIPFVKESLIRTELVIKIGTLSEKFHFFVPETCLEAAEKLLKSLFIEKLEW